MKILGICGSLRKASYNMAALRTCRELLPQGMTLEIADIGDLPLYNQDIFDAGMPASVKRVREQMAAADGLLFASPEYNFSVSAPLKNLVDWASRAPNQVFQDKPAAIFSATSGPLGGPRNQYELRKMLVQLWSYPLPRPEVFIGAANTKFDAEGRLTDDTTRKFLSELLTGFRDWIVRMQKK